MESSTNQQAESSTNQQVESPTNQQLESPKSQPDSFFEYIDPVTNIIYDFRNLDSMFSGLYIYITARHMNNTWRANDIYRVSSGGFLNTFTGKGNLDYTQVQIYKIFKDFVNKTLPDNIKVVFLEVDTVYQDFPAKNLIINIITTRGNIEYCNKINLYLTRWAAYDDPHDEIKKLNNKASEAKTQAIKEYRKKSKKAQKEAEEKSEETAKKEANEKNSDYYMAAIDRKSNEDLINYLFGFVFCAIILYNLYFNGSVFVFNPFFLIIIMCRFIIYIKMHVLNWETNDDKQSTILYGEGCR